MLKTILIILFLTLLHINFSETKLTLRYLDDNPTLMDYQISLGISQFNNCTIVTNVTSSSSCTSIINNNGGFLCCYARGNNNLTKVGFQNCGAAMTNNSASIQKYLISKYVMMGYADASITCQSDHLNRIKNSLIIIYVIGFIIF